MTGKNLWRDYRFLTREMVTFIARQEMDMFYELLSQRDQLRLKIEENGDRDYLKTEEGRDLAQEVRTSDARIALQLRGSMSQMKQRRQVRNAYQGSYTARVGSRTDYCG